MNNQVPSTNYHFPPDDESQLQYKQFRSTQQEHMAQPPFFRPQIPPQQPQFTPFPNPPGQVFTTNEDSGGSNGLAIAGFTLSLIGMILWLIPVVGIILPIIGLVFSALGRRSKTQRALATAGLILSIIALVLAGLFLLWWFLLIIRPPYYYR